MPAGLEFWGKNEAKVEFCDNPPGLTGTPGYRPGRLVDIAPAGYTTTDGSLADWTRPGDLTREDHHPSRPGRVVRDNRIVNNVITRTGRDYNSGIGVFVGYTEGTVVAHNEIFDMPYSGISVGWGWGMPDAGGGVYLDEGSADIEVSGNLIYRVRRPLMFNNRNQNRRATCKVEGNLHTPTAGTTPGVKGQALQRGSGVDVPHEPQVRLFQRALSAEEIGRADEVTGGLARHWDSISPVSSVMASPTTRSRSQSWMPRTA